jgi:hypothetical protein
MMVSEIGPSAGRNEKHAVAAAVATSKATPLTTHGSWKILQNAAQRIS